jgi:hypothetical protein
MITAFWGMALWSSVDGIGTNVSEECTAFIFKVEEQVSVCF